MPVTIYDGVAYVQDCRLEGFSDAARDKMLGLIHDGFYIVGVDIGRPDPTNDYWSCFIYFAIEDPNRKMDDLIDKVDKIGDGVDTVNDKLDLIIDALTP